MITVRNFLIQTTLLFVLILPFNSSVYAQNTLNGRWEGVFMNDFKVLITFKMNEGDQQEGTIQMFAGENMIQDDPLNTIALSGNELTFYIPVKETSFEGQVSNEFNEITGFFIFPDQSKHPLTIKKSKSKVTSVENYLEWKNKVYTPEALISDLEFLNKKLEELHPKLYAYSSQNERDELYEKLKSQADKNSNLNQFLLITSKLTDQLHCSHTGIRLPSSYAELQQQYENTFPLKLYFKEGKAYFIRGVDDLTKKLIPGSEIVSINDRSVKEILADLMPLLPADGNNQTTKYHLLNDQFNELFPLIADNETFRVSFRKGMGLNEMSINAVKGSNNPYINNSAEKEMTFQLDEKLAVLKIPSFGMRDVNRYIFQMDSVIEQVTENQTKTLVLDLRGNTGGHPIFAAQLLSYFVEKPFTYFIRNEQVPDFEPLYNPMQPNPLHFDGDIVVFVDGGCLSTTGHLISLLKSHTNAVFMGEEPGSTFTCNDFSQKITLPNTGLEVNIPTTTFATPATELDPFPLDYQVDKPVQDIVNGYDPYYSSLMKIMNPDTAG